MSLALAAALLGSAFLYPALGSDESGIYLFQGCTLSAKQGKACFSVVREDSRRIHVSTGSRIVRTSDLSLC